MKIWIVKLNVSADENMKSPNSGLSNTAGYSLGSYRRVTYFAIEYFKINFVDCQNIAFYTE